MTVPKHTKRVVLFNLGAIALILAAFELIARAFLSHNAPFTEIHTFNIEYQPSGFICAFAAPSQVIYAVTQNGTIDYQRIKYRINKYGYRGEDFAVSKHPDEIRIAFLGGSHVFDLNSYDYEGNPGFPSLIQKSFRERGYNLTVINAGLPGSDTRDIPARLLLDLHRYAPDIIVVNSIWNDTKWIARSSDSTLFLQEPPRAIRTNPMVEKVGVLDSMFGFSVLYRKARDLYWRTTLRIEDNMTINEGILTNPRYKSSDWTRGLDQYKMNVLAVVELIGSISAVPVLASEERLVSAKNTEREKRSIQYRMVNIESHAELVSLFKSCDSVLLQISKDRNVLLIDLNRELEELEDKLVMFTDHVHTTPAGSRFIADRYVEALEPIVKQIAHDRATK